MKRLSLLGFFGLLAGVLAGCPIFSGDGNGHCWDGNCGTGGTGGSFPGCYSSANCGYNETCGSDGQCHSGDCSIWGCASGICMIDPATQTPICQQGGTGGTGGSTNTGGSTSTGSTSTGSTNTGGSTSTGSTSSGTGGAGGSAPPAVCTAEGQQGECATGSICLSKVCWISCETPNESACAQQVTLNTCQWAIDQNKVLHSVCGDAASGTECSVTKACSTGLDCINGYCK